jgi:hypothetical protein
MIVPTNLYTCEYRMQQEGSNVYTLGNVILKIKNPLQTSPDKWTYQEYALTQTNVTNIARSIVEHKGYIYFLGEKGVWVGIAARLSQQNFLQDRFDRMEYLYDGNVWKAGEPSSTESIKTVLGNSGESSTVYMDHLGLFVKFFPTSDLGFSLYYSSSIEGPWKITDVMKDIGSPYNQFMKTIYAIKIHRELTLSNKNENEIIVTVNSQVADDTNGKGYVPVFISVLLNLK